MKGRRREYDGYAVGRRVLRLAPVWLLAVAAAFVLALLFLSRVGRRGEDLRNEATNRQSATPEAEHAPLSDVAPTAAVTPLATAETKGEADSFSVQVGAFAEASQANELVSRLRAAGFDARVVEAPESTHFHFQVRSGLYPTRDGAARRASELRGRGVAADTVIIEPEKK